MNLLRPARTEHAPLLLQTTVLQTQATSAGQSAPIPVQVVDLKQRSVPMKPLTTPQAAIPALQPTHAVPPAHGRVRRTLRVVLIPAAPLIVIAEEPNTVMPVPLRMFVLVPESVNLVTGMPLQDVATIFLMIFMTEIQ